MVHLSKKCECPICLRQKEFVKIREFLGEGELLDTFNLLIDHLYSVEEDLDCSKIYLQNLKNLYPKIAKEVITLEQLDQLNAKYPEKQI